MTCPTVVLRELLPPILHFLFSSGPRYLPFRFTGRGFARHELTPEAFPDPRLREPAQLKSLLPLALAQIL